MLAKIPLAGKKVFPFTAVDGLDYKVYQLGNKGMPYG
jgi:hypothetical protein